jgi:hypothetical protein
MEEQFIYCEKAESVFGKTKKAKSHYGDVSVEYLTSNKTPKIDTQAREYQREKVASLKWKQKIMLTVLSDAFLKIPQIHIRVVMKGKGVFTYELVDGQQRVTSIIDFINGKFRLGNGVEFNLGNGIDVRGMNIDDIYQNYSTLYHQIIDYRISCIWYENLTDEQTADLFINVLNNVNTMKPQEIRNAIRGKLSEYIRNSARFTKLPIFERTYDGTIYKLKNFSHAFNLSGRMEVDEWLSELIYLLQNGYRDGVSQTKHTLWISDIQKAGGDLSTDAQFYDFEESVLTPLLNFSESVIKSVPSDKKHRLTPMLSQILILYGYELKNKHGKLDVSKYVSKFFSIYTDWSCTTKKLYNNHFMWTSNGKGTDQLEPFNKLFNGKNQRAFQTITKVLDVELKANFDEFGVTDLDPKRTFSTADIIRKWEEQGGKCFYYNIPIERTDLAGDHYIPHSYGIKAGGVTTYDNLRVTSKATNRKKLTIHGDDFVRMVNNELNESK